MTVSYRDYLAPEVVSRLGRLDLIAKAVVEGFITGLHKSPYHGFSTEFAEHRQYITGDSLRYLDWKVYGRTDRMYVKRFEEETNLKSHILLDMSGSMDFSQTGPVTKFRYASMLAAALSLLMIRQRDSVGLVTFSDRVTAHVPPRAVRTQLGEIITAIDRTEPVGPTVTGDILHRLAERLTARGLVILISDLLLDPDDLMRGLKHFRHDGHEVLVFQVLDPAERLFEYSGEVRFRDLESGERITTQPWHIRDEYRRQSEAERSALVSVLHDQTIDYTLLDTSVPFDRAFTEYLAKRKRLH